LIGGTGTVGAALAAARAAGLDRLDAQWLLGHLLGRDSAWLLAHDADPLPTAASNSYADLVQRRAAGEPLAYLVGEAGFHGLTLRVTPDVLVPRPDTETLVDWALALLPTFGTARPRVLDLGTGSGAIALAVAHGHPAAEVMATDLSPAALAVAQANAQTLGLPLRWAQGAWWQAVAADARFDLVLSNPPYIAGGDPHLAALQHEPMLALSPGGDGLDALRSIVAGAPAHLAPGGWLLLEHGWDQAPAVAALLAAAGFEAVSHQHDLGGQVRCTGGRLPAENKG
jgi:release factor glutamine methyltransferase